MNDKCNPLPRISTPLFSPEDPEFGFSSASSGPSRRKFLKRTGGATLATALSWVANNQRVEGEVILSYMASSGAWGIKPIEPTGIKGEIDENGNLIGVGPVTDSINTTENYSGNYAYRSHWFLYVIWDHPTTNNELAYTTTATNAVKIIWEETLQRRNSEPPGPWHVVPANDPYLATRTLKKVEQIMSITKTISAQTGLVQNTPKPADYVPTEEILTATWELEGCTLTLDEQGNVVEGGGKDTLKIKGNGGAAPVNWEVELRFHRRFGTGNA